MAAYLHDLFGLLSSAYAYLLHALGLRGKRGTVVLVGLDNAGKTSLLLRLCTGGVRAAAAGVAVLVFFSHSATSSTSRYPFRISDTTDRSGTMPAWP